jgi:RimJ/RimL family protein N-acetyltransferase
MDLVDSNAPLVTPRLILEPLSVAHAEALFPSLLDERLYQFIPQDPPTSLAWLKERYERLSLRRSPDGREVWLNWAIRRRPEADYVGLVEATVRQDATALLAYFIFTPQQGKGYAREGCSAVLSHLGDACRVRRAIAEIDTRNQRSIALVESLGFLRTATTPAADFFKGDSSDEYRFERSLSHGESDGEPGARPME